MKTVLMQPKLVNKRGAVRITYSTDPYLIATGALRSMQRFAAIALTTRGTDTIRPWFGTILPQFPLMTMGDRVTILAEARAELQDAISQFFIIQDSMVDQLADADLIDTIDIVDVRIQNYNSLYMEVRFYPRNSAAITLSIAA